MFRWSKSKYWHCFASAIWYKYKELFKGLKELSSSLVDFFSSLSGCKLLNQCAHIFKNSLYTSKRFDSNLEKYFNENFYQVINIANSTESFVYFSFEKSLNFLINKHDSFSHFIKPEMPENFYINSFFSPLNSNSPNTIYINLYIDDFQLANPLLIKKSLKIALLVYILE